MKLSTLRLPSLALALVAVGCGSQRAVIAANQPPHVRILRPPYPGQRFNLPARVAPGDLMLIKVEAWDDDGTVGRVRLFANGELLAEWTNPPYAMVWQHFFEDIRLECRPTWTL